MTDILDATDRAIVNALQGGFPLSPEPYAEAAAELGIAQGDLIARLGRLKASGVLSRFGPMYDAEALGGAFSLCALSVPEERFDEVAGLVNARPEVAHNYERAHELNMWFVLGCETRDAIADVVAAIEAETGLTVYDFPKEREFFIGLKVEA